MHLYDLVILSLTAFLLSAVYLLYAPLYPPRKLRRKIQVQEDSLFQRMWSIGKRFGKKAFRYERADYFRCLPICFYLICFLLSSILCITNALFGSTFGFSWESGVIEILAGVIGGSAVIYLIILTVWWKIADKNDAKGYKIKRRPKQQMDYENGKRIFFACKGSHFFIDREFGDEYSKCNIPREIEIAWREEIKEKLLAEIAIEKGDPKIWSIFAYIDLLSAHEAIDFLVQCIHAEDQDTFSLLLLAEHLKHYLRYADDTMKIRIKDELLVLQNKLLHHPVTVDESYYREKWDIDAALSEKSIRHRIETLWHSDN